MNEATPMQTTEQVDRESDFQRRTLDSAIIDAAVEKWHEENLGMADVDAEARTVTIGDLGDYATTYRYGFGVNGELLLWNEEDGEEVPAELADDDAPASCEGCRSSGLSETESRSIHNES